MMRTSDLGRHGPLPVKRGRLLEWVRARIATGVLKPGDKLPDRAWFRKTFGLADHPVQQAFSTLAEEGFVRAVSGHGTQVANTLPFSNKFLLLLCTKREIAGVRMFAPALRAAVERVAADRGVSFDVREVVDVSGDSVDYAETLSEIRRQRFAGVLAQNVTKSEHGLKTFSNIDNVPIAYFGVRSEVTQGNRAVSLGIYDAKWERSLMERHLEGLHAVGCRKVAVFKPHFAGDLGFDGFLDIARSHGLEVVRDGYHHFDMLEWDPHQFGRWIDLFLRSDAGRAADSIVLGDDNMLDVFVSRCCAIYGSKACERYRISCHWNFPLPPKVAFPAIFHGPDLVDTASSLVDFANDCRGGCKKPRMPRVKII